MEDDRIERLLRGYRLPDVPRDLDRRVLSEGAMILARARTRATMEEGGRLLLNLLGFGYLTWLVDFVTTTDAEYRVDFI
jgi:hypothetical protein